MSQLPGNTEIISSNSIIFQCRKMRPEKSDSFKVTQLVRGRAGPVPRPPGPRPRVLPSPSRCISTASVSLSGSAADGPRHREVRTQMSFCPCGSVMPGVAHLSWLLDLGGCEVGLLCASKKLEVQELGLLPPSLSLSAHLW